MRECNGGEYDIKSEIFLIVMFPERLRRRNLPRKTPDQKNPLFGQWKERWPEDHHFHITTFNPAILGRMVLKGIENGYAVSQVQIRGVLSPVVGK